MTLYNTVAACPLVQGMSSAQDHGPAILDHTKNIENVKLWHPREVKVSSRNTTRIDFRNVVLATGLGMFAKKMAYQKILNLGIFTFRNFLSVLLRFCHGVPVPGLGLGYVDIWRICYFGFWSYKMEGNTTVSWKRSRTGGEAGQPNVTEPSLPTARVQTHDQCRVLRSSLALISWKRRLLKTED